MPAIHSKNQRLGVVVFASGIEIGRDPAVPQWLNVDSGPVGSGLRPSNFSATWRETRADTDPHVVQDILAPTHAQSSVPSGTIDALFSWHDLKHLTLDQAASVQPLNAAFIVAQLGCLRKSGVRFDPAPGLHPNDLDFCRASERAGLSLCTWPIACTHASRSGSIHSMACAEACSRYLAKYDEGQLTP